MVARNKKAGKKKSAGPGNRRRLQPRARQMVVVSTQRPRKPRPRRTRGRGSQGGGPNTGVNFTFLVNSFAGNASGTIKFGPNLTESSAFVGVLGSFQRYRIVSLQVHYVTEASKMDRGCIAYHVDTSCSMRASGLLPTTSWPVTQSALKTYGAGVLGDQPHYEHTKEQFWFLYKGNGSSDIAGHLRLTIRVVFTNTL
ncbi:coat protein [Grapevine enamovirus 1]|nr:coat protein [Grapevine enamovirus 1]